MIKGTGVDIIEISRIEKSLTNEKFIERIFTKKEQEYCNSRKQMAVSSYAARFAAKEAFSKAMGTGIGREVTFQDLEILPNKRNKPIAESKQFTGNIHLSISHSK